MYWGYKAVILDACLLSDQIGGEGVHMLSYAYRLIYLIFGILIQVEGKPKINEYT